MKTIIIVLCLMFPACFAFSQRNILIHELERVGAKNFISSSEKFNQFPHYNERQLWENIPEEYKKAKIKQADQFIDYNWPTIPATLFLEYSQTGNRGNFEDASFKRRNVLSGLIIAECIEHKGRYLNAILNGVWSICEESYWGVPAHVNMQKKQTGLPDVSEPTVDLFAAETASVLAWTYYLLGTRLDSISPAVSERIIYETDRRILTPNLLRKDFWWMGFSDRVVNNWNPWIISNWLTCVLILEKDSEKKGAAIKKIAACLDNFLNSYPEDGGCDEGPTYWGRAGGSLFDCLELFYQASQKSFNVFQNPLVKNIGSYIYKAHIADAYFINFADASARTNIDPAIVFNYGKRIANDTLKSLGTNTFREQDKNEDEDFDLHRQLATVFLINELQSNQTVISPASEYWLPDIQILTARSNNTGNDGLYLAAQGGHNAESHNHNDVGNFIVYYDGKPALIDIGVESYTAKTFSSKRYEIWTMQSAYHNTPTVNGYMQSAGREFAAKNVEFSSSKNEVSLLMNIENAYPKEAGIKTWKRSWDFKRNQSIILTDDFVLSSNKGDIFFTLMSSCPVEIKKDKLVLSGDGFNLNIAYDSRQLLPETEVINITDSRLKKSWNDKLYRIKLHYQTKNIADKIKLVITGQKNN